MSNVRSLPSARPGLLAVLVLAVLAMSGCRLADHRSPSDATLTEETYENRYFGFTLALPEGWSVASPELEAHLRRTGESMLAGDDPVLRANFEASQSNTHQLLTISRYEMGSAVPFNPMVAVLAERIAHAPGVKTGADYLYHLAQILERSAVPLQPKGEPSGLELGGREFHRRDFEMSTPVVIQAYIFRREGDYALGFVLTARDDAELEELLGMVSQVRFD